MEKQSISPHPGGGDLSDWIAKPYSIVFTAVILFVLIFGIALFQSGRHFNDTRTSVLASDMTTTNLLADLILQYNRMTIGILQSYAHRPKFIAAVEKKDLAGIDSRLSDLKKNADIDTTFVADKSGILLTNLPVFPESRGKDFSQRDWYKGISTHWKPYVSTVFKQIVGDKPLAVAICVPVFDEKGRPIGILGNSQRLNFIQDTIEKVAFSPYTTVNVIDRLGKILYSNKIPYLEKITDYPFFPILEPALKGKGQQIEINDPQKDQEKRYLTVVPIGDIGWTIIIERSLKDMYRSSLGGFIEIGAVSFLLFLLITFLLVYLRKVTLFKKTEELLQAETKLRQKDEKLRALSKRQEAILAAVPAIIMEVDNNKIYTWANSVGIDFFGEDVIGKEAALYFEGKQDTYEQVRPLFNGGEEIIYVESWQRRRDGQKRLLAWWCRVRKDEKGNVEGALSSAYDITDSKQVEQALRESEERFRSLFEQAAVGVAEIEISTSRFITVNRRLCEMVGRTEEEMLATTSHAITHPEDTPLDEEKRALLTAGKIRQYSRVKRYLRKDGESVWVNLMVSSLGKPGEKSGCNMIVVEDITERKRVDDRVQLAREVLDLLNRQSDTVDAIHDILQRIKKGTGFEAIGIRLKEGDDFPYYATNGFPEDFVLAERRLCAYDEDGKVVRDQQGNPVLECMCGNIVCGRTDASLPFFTENGSFWTNSTTDLLTSTTAEVRQSRTRNRCNGEGYESVALIPLKSGDEVIGLLQLNDRRRNRFTLEMIHFFEGLGASIGIALTRKQVVEKLVESEGKYRNILESIQDGYFEVDIAGNVTFFNDSVCRMVGITRAEMMGMNNRQYTDEENSKILYKAFNEIFKTGEPLTGLCYEIIGKDGTKLYIESSVSLIRNTSGQPIGFRGIMRNTTERKQAEKKLEDTLESLRKAVGTTIHVLASTVETRDPYTAGHQTRSADLARAIGTEMELPQEKIDAIRIAGSIHDIGKLSIPAEILSKPTRLSEIEFSLIKEHSRKGFEMLKDVESPWPLADIVHQHHERIDGSGYPRNLKGDDILIEARILAVADVVEAMASHRPYRPGLGIDAALAEIEKNRGVFYDDAVADACLRLFREKGFQLQEA